METVLVQHGEDGHHPDDVRAAERTDRLRVHRGRGGHDGVRRAQVRQLAQQGGRGLRGDLVAVRAARGGDRRHDEPFHHGGGREQDPVAGGRIRQQLQRQLGAQDRAPEVHQDHDTGRAVHLLDGRGDLHRVRAQGGLVQPGGHGDAHLTPPDHLLGQLDGRDRQRPAVRDHHQTDAAPRAGRPVAGQEVNPVVAARSRATVVAPGSWWPTLRSPR